MQSPDAKEMIPIVHKAMPMLHGSLKDPNAVVKRTAGLTYMIVGEILPQPVFLNLFEQLIASQVSLEMNNLSLTNRVLNKF